MKERKTKMLLVGIGGVSYVNQSIYSELKPTFDKWGAGDIDWPFLLQTAACWLPHPNYLLLPPI